MTHDLQPAAPILLRRRPARQDHVRLDALAAQVRAQARALAIELVSQPIAITDGGNDLEEA